MFDRKQPDIVDLTEVITMNSPPGLQLAHIAHKIFIEKLGIPTCGILHLGGHVGEELALYAHLGFEKIVFVEPLPDPFSKLRTRVGQFNDFATSVNSIFEGAFPCQAVALNYAVSDSEGQSKFYKTRSAIHASLIKPNKTAFDKQWADFSRFAPWYKRSIYRFLAARSVKFEEVHVPSITLDKLVEQLPNGWIADNFSTLRMNIQGSELMALKGATQLLKHLKAIYLEVNLTERYEGSPSVSDFDEFLNTYSFRRVFGHTALGHSGQLLYIRD